MTKTVTGGHPKLKMVNPTAAGIDIGSTMHMAAVNPDACDRPVRAFGTFTQDLHDLADWLRSCGVWDKVVTGLPRPCTTSELQYSDRKLRSRTRLAPSATGSDSTTPGARTKRWT